VTPWTLPGEPGELTDDQHALLRAVTGFCEDRSHRLRTPLVAEDFLLGVWRPLARLGVLALATPEGGGGAAEVAATSAVLGSFGVPGPLLATVLAGQVLDDGRRRPVLDGESVCAIGPLAVVPWATVAAVFLEVEGGEVWLCEPVGEPAPGPAIGGEPAARVVLRRTMPLPGAGPALALADVAAAAYLTGAAAEVVNGAAGYAADRHQFDRPIGDFQGVAFPLADAHTHLAAAADLTWQAARSLDEGRGDGPEAAAVARLSARRAALAGVYACHQVYGASGYAEDGPMAGLRRRIAQTALLPPDPTALARTVLGGLLPGPTAPDPAPAPSAPGGPPEGP
jgi:alkylation response protein AidB-like acyl-CoA dehydrogenase